MDLQVNLIFSCSCQVFISIYIVSMFVNPSACISQSFRWYLCEREQERERERERGRERVWGIPTACLSVDKYLIQCLDMRAWERTPHTHTHVDRHASTPTLPYTHTCTHTSTHIFSLSFSLIYPLNSRLGIFLAGQSSDQFVLIFFLTIFFLKKFLRNNRSFKFNLRAFLKIEEKEKKRKDFKSNEPGREWLNRDIQD